MVISNSVSVVCHTPVPIQEERGVYVAYQHILAGLLIKAVPLAEVDTSARILCHNRFQDWQRQLTDGNPHVRLI